MIALRRIAIRNALGAAIALSALAGCATTPVPEPPPSAPAPPPPAPPSPPPVNLAGKWKFSAAGGGSCIMTFGDVAGAAEGSIAPAGGCPGNFFTSRKWTYEHDMLIIHDHKGETLAQFSFAADRFEGTSNSGGAITLGR